MFTSDADKKAVLTIVLELFDENWGVGCDQLTRSLLILTDGNLVDLRKTISTMEPRDIIMSAEAKCGNPRHYFIPPFDLIELANNERNG